MLTLAVLAPALRGPFVSDDFGYLVANPYTASLDAQHLAAMLDPFGPASRYTANYAPLHLLMHAVERRLFGADPFGYHVVNALVHALCCALLVALLRRSRVPPPAALVAGALFALHPANVEAVAWISQLKTTAALALSLAALLLHRDRPWLSVPLFAAALLTKASAVFALPMAAVLTWARAGGPGGGRRQGWALVAWVAVLAAFSVPQLASFRHLGQVDVPAYDDPWLHARTIAAIGARYLAMAATGAGTSAWHEPGLADSWLDPWWLAALLLGGLLGARALVALRGRREEAAWWVAAAASFAPISQLLPFAVPMADRYLYFVLPGLLGGALLALRDGRARLERALAARGVDLPRRAASVAALSFAVALAAIFAAQSVGRARLWRSETLLLLDAARHYPRGGTARFLEARRAAQEGDVDAAIEALRAAAERGVDRFAAIADDPGLAPLRDEPAFRAFVRELAGRFLERARGRGFSTQAELRTMARAHVMREEWADAETLLERALEAGGPEDGDIRRELASLRNRRLRGDASRRPREGGRRDGEAGGALGP